MVPAGLEVGEGAAARWDKGGLWWEGGHPAAATGRKVTQGGRGGSSLWWERRQPAVAAASCELGEGAA